MLLSYLVHKGVAKNLIDIDLACHPLEALLADNLSIHGTAADLHEDRIEQLHKLGSHQI
jgi:hypothetical protein